MIGPYKNKDSRWIKNTRGDTVVMTAHRQVMINTREGRDIWEQGHKVVSRDAATYTQFSGGFLFYDCGIGGVF
jgi:hypothetical protein